MEEVVLTSAGILELLSQIDELSEYDLDVSDSDGNIAISIGDSIYNIQKPSNAVEVPEEVVAEIADIADEVVSDIEPTDTAIESGIVKEALKTLLLGGAVRLISKIVK